jgi:DNA polymerase-3 subunit gamma/tau
MRDALSLLDQAIGYGNGNVNTEDVKNMLGATAPELLLTLLSSLLEKDAVQILSTIEMLSASGVDFHYVLEEFLSLLHQIALLQAVPGLAQTPAPLRKEAGTLATRISGEDLQLYYQIGLIGRRDLPLAPTPRSGFEMILLRMLSFHPESIKTTHAQQTQSTLRPTAPPLQPPAQDTATVTQPRAKLPADEAIPPGHESWSDLLPKLNLRGIALVVASHCTCTQQTSDEIHLLLDKNYTAMLNQDIKQRIASALNTYYNKPIQLTINTGEPITETAVQTHQRKAQEAQSQAITQIEEDAYLNELINAFDAQILPNSIQPKDS